MRSLKIWWAALMGWFVDYMLTLFLVGSAYLALGIDDMAQVQLSNPLHLVVAFGLPVLMTMIGGGVAGWLSPEEPLPAGAMVGGLGLIMLNVEGLDRSNPLLLPMIIAQCVAVILAAAAAAVASKRRLARPPKN